MILEQLDTLLRNEAAALPPANPWRASAMGHCIRKGCFEELGVKPEPMQSRRMLVLKQGSSIHDDLLTPLLKKALGWRLVDGKDFGDTFVEIDGAKIGYHIDFAFQHTIIDTLGNETTNGIGVAEIKSMSDYAFNRALNGEIEKPYLCQAWVYKEATDFNPVVFICYRKETSHMLEIVFDRNATEVIVTKTLTGNPLELAKHDPITLTTISSPFDDSVGDYVRERIKYLKLTKLITPPYGVDWLINEVPGADAVEDEVEKVQGKKAALEKLNQYTDAAGHAPIPQQNGSWYTFNTGRAILGFPCGGYCGFMKICFPTAQMELKGDKPVWVIP